MKYKLKYSPNASDKLRNIKAQVTETYGRDVAAKSITKIMGEIKELKDNPKKGPSIEALLGIPAAYRFLHVCQNYIFYRVEKDTIFVAEIFNEREDFMQRMFGINLRTKDSMDFWGE